MIKETDLRIGNVIYYQSSEDGLLPNIVDWQDLKWLSENPDGFNETFKPIPISWVTLLKLGWEINHDGGVYHLLSKSVGEWGLFIITSDGNGLHYEHRNASLSIDIEYYHQLENIFYFTTGKYLDNQLEELEVSTLANEILSDGSNEKELYNTKTMRKIKKTMKSKSYNIYLGIDPDVSKSGVAYYVSETKVLELSNLSFFNLYDYLKFAKENQGDNNLTIVIEAGWLNKSNWHKVAEGSSSINAKIGQHTGANHEVGKKIVEMCEYLDIKYILIRPTKTKIRHENFKKLTGIIGSTNQEQRDAAMLVWGL